jgi:hypothetical protein
MNGIITQSVKDIRAARAFAGRVFRTGKALAGKGSAFPLWLRLLYIVGMVQIPVLPVDEIALCAALVITACVPAYRRALVTAWQASAPRAVCRLAECDCERFAA